MFILDSLFVSGLRWVLDTVKTAADAEMDDDTALLEELMAAEMRREMGEVTDQEFADIEAGLLARIRTMRERREGGSGPIAFGGASDQGSKLHVEATVTGDFHDETVRPSTRPAERRTSSDRPRQRATPRRKNRRS